MIKTTGLIVLSGISIPEDPYAFYTPVNEKIAEYLTSPKDDTLLEFKLEYFNTSSTLIIRNLIRTIAESASKSRLTVKWYYEEYDDDMKEAGQEFQLLFLIH